ncbi:CSC1-like protein HYP1 [Vitis vinifera]|uniref:CSC1-like protein HYP1 n=1 Tax=Vitis vinifera TaxID=29760 RepID=A0A438H988_VITVI|nr:CSC1-like protein HYP1 [Vitis vinifera]
MVELYWCLVFIVLVFLDVLWLWIHFSAAYVFTGVEYSYISSKRIAWFYHSKPQPHQFTILVSGIPVSSGSRVGESVESFFTKYHPSTYLSHTVVRRTNKLQKVIDDAEKLYRTLGHLKSKRHTQQRFRRDGFLGLSGRRVDLLDQYEKKLEDLEDNLRMEQSSLAGEEVRAAFVSFKSRSGAAIALHIQQGIDPLISFLIPVVIVQGLTHLDQLEVWFPFLRGVLTMVISVAKGLGGAQFHADKTPFALGIPLGNPRPASFWDPVLEREEASRIKRLQRNFKCTFVSQVITGYLPSLILQLFLSLVPPIMIILSSMQGYISFRSVLYQVNIILEPKEIPKILAEVVPAQASFFIAYVVTSGWTSLSSEIFRMFPLICSFVKQHFTGNDGEEFQVPSIPYHKEIPTILFFGLLGVTYFFLAPLILPFLLVYFCLAYIVYRNQVS